MKKIVTILGARPQFIKAAILSSIFRKYDEIEEIIVHTGQHFDSNMSSVFFTEMKIPKPAYNLGVQQLSHAAMTGQMLEKIEKILLNENPDAVIVYGDTNSTLAGSLAAKKIGIRVIHIEAGLRSFNMSMPEEVNRIITDRISDLLLCPTDVAMDNLKKEGFSEATSRVVKCGDIMKDAVAFYGKSAMEKSTILKSLDLTPGAFVLATIHREDNTSDINKLKSIFEGIEAISAKCRVVLPLHPRTRKMLEKFNLTYDITLIDPVGYFDMLVLLKHCKMVITDSGGLQKEAFFNKKHCIIARDETEWVELIEKGFATLIGSDKVKMLEAFQEFKTKSSDFSVNLYGNNVGEFIYKEIRKL